MLLRMHIQFNAIILKHETKRKQHSDDRAAGSTAEYRMCGDLCTVSEDRTRIHSGLGYAYSVCIEL